MSFCNEDGHAQERSLIPEVLQLVEADQLWIEDRNFCTLGLMFGMPRRGARSWCASTASFKASCSAELTRRHDPQRPGL